MLSQYQIIGSLIGCPNCASKLHNQIDSHVAMTTPLYFSFEEDKATIGCFFEDHMTIALPKLKTYPKVDL